MNLIMFRCLASESLNDNHNHTHYHYRRLGIGEIMKHVLSLPLRHPNATSGASSGCQVLHHSPLAALLHHTAHGEGQGIPLPGGQAIAGVGVGVSDPHDEGPV